MDFESAQAGYVIAAYAASLAVLALLALATVRRDRRLTREVETLAARTPRARPEQS